MHRARRALLVGRRRKDDLDRRVRDRDGRSGRGAARRHEGRPDEGRPDGELPRSGRARTRAHHPGAAPTGRTADDPGSRRVGPHRRARRPTRPALRRMGPRPDRRGIDRPGPSGHHSRWPRGGGEGAVPRRAIGPSAPISPPPTSCSGACRCCSRASTPSPSSPSSRSASPRSSTTSTRPATSGASPPISQVIPTSTSPTSSTELSTRRVLTTELAVGARFDDVLTWSQEERNLAAETIYRFAFGSIYRLGAFNGDPHPGNYLFRPGGQVTFLDFGLVKTLHPREPGGIPADAQQHRVAIPTRPSSGRRSKSWVC